MPPNDPDLIAAELCGCISCDISNSYPQVFCNAPAIAAALAAARMEGRLDVVIAIGSDHLENALPQAKWAASVVPEAQAVVTMLEETIAAHSAHFDRMSLAPESEALNGRPILEWQTGGRHHPNRRVLTRVDGPHHTEAAIAEAGYCAIYDEHNEEFAELPVHGDMSLAESMDHAWDELVERGWFGATLDCLKPRSSNQNDGVSMPPACPEAVPNRVRARGDDPK